MNATNLTIAAVTSVFGEHRPLVRGTRAEDAYYSANSCDWLAAVIHALTRAAAALPPPDRDNRASPREARVGEAGLTLDIIGAGFGRTGTSSMKIALEHLGFGPCHHMFEVRDNPHLLGPWEKVADGVPQDWDEVFAGYRSQIDWPGARVWRELAGHYPDAKVILTVRDPGEWYDSLSATIVPFVDGRGTYPDAHANAITAMGHKLITEQVFGGRWKDRAHAISVFNAHNAEVERTIPRDRLLTFDVSQGWEPLCAFLDVPVPGISFPKLNSSKQFVETWKEETTVA